MEFGRAYLSSLRFYFLHHQGFLDFMESQIKKQVEDFDKTYPLDESLKKSDPDYYYFLVDDISEQWWQQSRDFPAEFRAAYLCQLYNGIETHLQRLCDQYHKVHSPPKSFKKMSGKGEWAQKSKYLKKYAKVDFKALQKDWDFLYGVRAVRNQIVHHHSAVIFESKDWAEVTKFIKTYPNLITFTENPYEKEDGELAYKKYPHHAFEFRVISPEINHWILIHAQSFFNELIPQIAFK